MATSVRPNQVAHQRVRDFNLLESRLRWPSTNLRRFVTFRTHPSQELSVEQPWGAPMPRTLISSSSKFETDIGYSRAVIDGDWIFVSGTTGFDYATMTIDSDVVAQCEQAMRNIASVLSQAGAFMKDILRVRYILPDRSEFEACWPVLKKYLG